MSLASKAEVRPRGRPPANDAAISREQILESALKAFAASGFEAMSIRALTRELGVSHSLVHHYFGSKQALWEEGMALYFGAFRNRAMALLPGLDPGLEPIDAAREFIRESVRITARYPDCVRILLDEGARGGPRLDYLYREFIDPVGVAWDEAVERIGRDSVGFHPPDRRALYFLLTFGASAPFCAPALAGEFEGPTIGSDEATEYHANVIADMLIDGMRIR